MKTYGKPVFDLKFLSDPEFNIIYEMEEEIN
jgi:hypothetical protein